MSRIADEIYNAKFPPLDGERYILVSKDGKFKTKDYLNKSGELTEYVQNTLGIPVISSYRRCHMLETTGKIWWEEYFDVQTEPLKPTKKCPYCDWETVDIDNKSGMFTHHIKKIHGLTIEQYLNEHPEDKDYFTYANPSLNLALEENEDKFVTCQICGKKMASIDGRHLSHHGITKSEYIRMYGTNTVCKCLHDKLSVITTKANENMKYSYVSKPEMEIIDYIKSLGVECDKNRSILHGKEIDMYMPEYNLAIEFNGNKYHTEKYGGKGKYYHLEKTNECKKQGINLIHIFEDEYYLHTDIVLSKIRHLLGKDNELPKIPGRKCLIAEIDKETAKTFLETYHIQGYVHSTAYFGAFYQDELIAVMTFKKEDKTSGKWELNRFASNFNYVLQGVGGKLFKTFIVTYKPDEVKSFMDRRWCSSEETNIYTKLGFQFEKYTYPDYRYYNSSIDRYERVHKFNFRKKHLNRRFGLDLSLTEKEMTEILGYDRIWDCGLIKYVWKKE